MAKLKCVFDNRRVHVIDEMVIHRDGTPCMDSWVEIAGKTYHATNLRFQDRSTEGSRMGHVRCICGNTRELGVPCDDPDCPESL